MSTSKKDIFDPDRLREKWIPQPPKSPEDSHKAPPVEALELWKAFLRILYSDFAEHKQAFEPLVNQARELLDQQFPPFEGDGLAPEDLKENQVALGEILHQIETLIEAFQMVQRGSHVNR